MKKWLKHTIITTICIAVGLIIIYSGYSYTVHLNNVHQEQIINHYNYEAHKNFTYKISYNKASNNYWNNRINNFAKERQKEYHPNINQTTHDLGYLPTANNKYMIKPNKIYRGQFLTQLNQSGANYIKSHHFTHVIDIRAKLGPDSSILNLPQPNEVNSSNNKFNLHIHYQYSPIENSNQETVSWPYRLRLGEAYRFGYWYSLNPQARKSYHKIFMTLIKHHETATDIVCNQGRDRTGATCVLLENILGVSQQNIYNDFLLTNHYEYQSSFDNQLERIKTFYNIINEKYGSMHNYIHKGLHLNNQDIKTLKKEYLIKK